MTSSRARRARTDRKTTARKSNRADSALCKSLAKKMEDLNSEDGHSVSVNAYEAGQSVDENLQGHLEQVKPLCPNKSEFVEYVPENYNSIGNCLLIS